MRPGEVERWVIAVVDRLEQGLRVEDDRVECKRELIEHSKAARRLAGHANQARDDRVLWVVGVDEDATPPVVGLEPGGIDPADWWARVEARFHDVAPALTWVYVPVSEGKTVLGLGFDTSRLPYVVKVSEGEVSREVPWREGTRTRSANRSDLLKLLVPLTERPRLSVLGGYLQVSEEVTPEAGSNDPDHLQWYGKADLYIDCGTSFVLPNHRCTGGVTFDSGEYVPLQPEPGAPSAHSAPSPFQPTPPSALLAEKGDKQVVIYGSSKFWLMLTGGTDLDLRGWLGSSGRLDVQIGTAGPDPTTVKLAAVLSPLDADELGPNRVAQWKIQPID